MRKGLSTLLAIGCLVLTVSAAQACTRNVSAKAAKTVVPETRINQKMLDDAVRVEVNYHRCRAGLAPVKDAGSKLNRLSATHSQWMAQTQTLSHTNTIKGKSSLGQRVKASGVKYRTGTENIGYVHRYRIDNVRFKVLAASECKFQKMDGTPLPAHSYASLARHIVTLWMNSPGHRKNILAPNVNRTTTSAAFTDATPHCGQFWLTQNFVG